MGGIIAAPEIKHTDTFSLFLCGKQSRSSSRFFSYNPHVLRISHQRDFKLTDCRKTEYLRSALNLLSFTGTGQTHAYLPHLPAAALRQATHVSGSVDPACLPREWCPTPCREALTSPSRVRPAPPHTEEQKVLEPQEGKRL